MIAFFLFLVRIPDQDDFYSISEKKLNLYDIALSKKYILVPAKYDTTNKPTHPGCKEKKMS